MAYVILVNNDNSLYGSQKEKIIQREKLFNKLWFLVAPHYNGFDMSKCTVTMRYLLPISREFRTETLILSEERYENYLKYVLPIDTNLTKEWGDIELNLTFTLLDDEDATQHVRKTTNCILKITPIPDWDSIVPDPALSAIDQRIIKQDAQIKALKKLANALDSNQVDNLIYNDKEETLQLSAKGVGVGSKVSVRDMLDDGTPVVDLDSNVDGNPDNPDNEDGSGSNNCDCDCDCNCKDNEDDYNIVEF
ncbi:MAG: hypothetical protein J6R59_09740 [Paludibacteraceae bacterium]|nr:hypothetical protein [Paludibacteraceae bacterium]